MFDSSNSQRLPIFRMSLTFDDEKMEIYPTLQDLEATILEILTSMTNTLQVKNRMCSVCIYNNRKNRFKIKFFKSVILMNTISENTAGLTVAASRCILICECQAGRTRAHLGPQHCENNCVQEFGETR